jgi:hypothetical protein
MELKKEVRPLPAIRCDECNLRFSPTIEEVAAAESIKPD